MVDYESLPPQAKEMAAAAKLSPQVVDQNFELFADVVRFVTNKNKIIPDVIDSTLNFFFFWHFYLSNIVTGNQVVFEGENPNQVYKVESTAAGSG